jgi:predicted nucleotidyltransferase
MSNSLLLGPTARRAILSRTFLDPSREHHLRELVRLTGLAPRSVQQEVEKLVGADLLVERRAGNRRYLRANDRHTLFRAIREIVLKTEGLADVLRDALSPDGVEFAFAYGSIAAAQPRAGSDIDLLIVGSVGLREVVRRLKPAHDVLGREINPNVWTRQEFERRRRENDPFLSRVLAGPTIPIVGTAAEGGEHEP